jgi:AraC-like DNA-binding protein
MAHVRCVFCWDIPLAKGYACHAHGHECTEIVLSLGTAGILRQGSQTHTYRDGSVFVYQPGHNHWIENRDPGDHICLGIIGGRAESLAEGLWQVTPALRQRFLEVRAALQAGGPLQQDRLDLLAGLIVLDLFGFQPEDRWKPASRAEQARAVIEGRLSEEISLEELAKRVFVSAEYLRQLFRKEFGESITHYVLRRRLELASRLLRTTSDPIKRIAWQAGFPNEFYFSRAFRKALGVTPPAYRAGANPRTPPG